MPARSVRLAAIALPFLLSTAVFSPGLLHSQTVSSLAGDSVVSVRIRFGLTDTGETAWDGSVSVSNGDLLSVRDWHPRPENEMAGEAGWKLSTHKGVNFRWRPWEKPPPFGPTEYYWAPGVIVDLKSSPSTRLDIETKNGNFSFNPTQLQPGRPATFLEGGVVVDRVPSAELLSSSQYEDDFASMLSGENGEVWVCWVAYRDKASEILARWFDGEPWGEIQKVSQQPGDVHLAKMGRDGEGRPWVVSSEQVNGNWDLYGRMLEDGDWSSPARLSSDGGPDIFPNLATDSGGGLWVVWQGFRDGQADIFARRYDGSRWSVEERISSSPANDWEPVIAADGEGAIYVAWDTYDKGNYDIVMRKHSRGEWSGVIVVADSPRYEAHVSLAADQQNRLWAAWNESGTNWGKDTGFSLNTEGTRLYEWRSIGVGVWDGKAWSEPVQDINRALPAELREYNDFPVLYPDAEGRMWLFARHRTLRQKDMQSETPAHRAVWEIWGSTLQGEQWTTPVHLPFTRGRQDVRWGLASDGRGNLFAAWPTDNRDYEAFLFEHADVYAARLPALSGPAEAPKLVPRVLSELTAYPLDPEEEKNLRRIREYTVESEGKTYHIYRGDTHRHSEFSMDGNNDGSLLQSYRYAFDAASLDYLLMSEHNHAGGPDLEYPRWLLNQTVNLLSVAGRFQPFYGYERSLPYPNGHRNILFTERNLPTLPMTQAERRGEEGAGALYEYLKKYKGIAISHTSATGMGTDWRDNDPEVEPLVEIYQGDRVSAEYQGAPRAAHGGNLNSAPGNFRPAGYVWNAWAKGYKLGIQAASDHLSTHISYACTIAEEFTREGLIEAMKKRHSYGATDNIILDYRLQAGGKEYLQGDIVEVAGEFQLAVKIIGTTPLRQIDIIKNQTFLHNRQNQPQETSFTFVDNEAGTGENYYYVRVIQNDGNMAWSSPIWVMKR